MTLRTLILVWLTSIGSHLFLLIVVLWGVDENGIEPESLIIAGVIAMLCVSLWTAKIRYRATARAELSQIAEALWAPDRLSRYKACLKLSVLVGNRFGWMDERSVELWKNWWLQHGSGLEWDPKIAGFVERELTMELLEAS